MEIGDTEVEHVPTWIPTGGHLIEIFRFRCVIETFRFRGVIEPFQFRGVIETFRFRSIIEIFFVAKIGVSIFLVIWPVGPVVIGTETIFDPFRVGKYFSFKIGVNSVDSINISSSYHWLWLGTTWELWYLFYRYILSILTVRNILSIIRLRILVEMLDVRIEKAIMVVLFSSNSKLN